MKAIKNQLLQDIRTLIMAVMNKILSIIVIAQGGIDNTLRVADQYCEDALSALQSIRDFDGKGILSISCSKLSR